MARELKTGRIVIGLPVVLALVFSVVVSTTTLAQVSFTGNVEYDFKDDDPVIWICRDAEGLNVTVPGHNVSGTRSGWDIKDLRLKYDPRNDILYVGINSWGTIGDADSDGNEGPPATWGGGNDFSYLGGSECVSVYFDLNQDGSYDVIVGVPVNSDFSAFGVYNYNLDPTLFGTPIPGHLAAYYWDAGSAPDLEFAITNFAGLPDQDSRLGEFDVGVFMGSQDDGAIGEDYLECSASLAIPPPVGGSATPVGKAYLVAPWVALGACAALVAFLILRKRRHA